MTNKSTAHPDHSGENYSLEKVDGWLGNLVAVVKELVAKVKDLERNLSIKDDKIIEFEKKLICKNPVCLYRIYLKKKDNGTKEAEAVLLATISKETANKTRIENNITISGDVESSSTVNEDKKKYDEDKVAEILKLKLKLKLEIDNDQVKRISRLKRKNPNTTPAASSTATSNVNTVLQTAPSLILVEFHNVITQQKAIGNAKNLKNEPGMNTVFINKDKTENERIIESKLRAERNKRNLALPNVVEGTNGR